MTRSSIRSYNRPYSKARSKGKGWYEKAVYVPSAGKKVAPIHREVALKGHHSRPRPAPSSSHYSRQLMSRSKQQKTVKTLNEESFIEYHKTGHIQEGTYEQYEKDLSWLKKSESPILYKTVIFNGEELEFRKSGEKLKYVKTDKSGEIVRDEKGTHLELSDAEIKKKGLPTHDTTIVAFNKKGEAVGYASDEFGATGVYVLKEYQRKGIGLELLTEYRKQFKPERRLGQMTPSGEQLARKYYKTRLAS